jgi:serine/threonine-protein kinase
VSSITCPNTACGAVLEGTDLRHCPRCGSFLPLAQQQDPADPLVGQPILGGKYRILSIIGEGGMGKVYLAEQKLGTATRKVAIKTLQPDLAGDPQIIARFHRETQTVIELEHPNTIKFYDFGELDEGGKKLFVVMEFIQGESLAHVLARGAIDVQRTERIMAQICGSLQEAHDRGIIHRDLKPENIYLTQKGARGDFVKVLDFGIAKRDEAGSAEEAKLTRQGMVLGTPPYMSPEQFTGQTLDARSDIYALGVMAYEMLTGVLPFTAQTPWEWATKHLTAEPTPIERQPTGAHVPPRHRAAIMRALRKNRDERQKSVTEFLQELAGHSEGATDWTASSTSMPGANQPMLSNPGTVTPPPGVNNFGMAPTGFQPQQSHPVATPNPFAPGSNPGFVPSPSNAGFAAVPPTVAPGMAGSNPGFAPTQGFSPVPSQPGYGTLPGAAPPQKRSTGLIIGIIAVLGVLAGGSYAAYSYLSDDADDAPQQQQAQPTVPTNPNVGQAGMGQPMPNNPQMQPMQAQIPAPPQQQMPPQPMQVPVQQPPQQPVQPPQPVQQPVATNSEPSNAGNNGGSNSEHEHSSGGSGSSAAAQRGIAALGSNNFAAALAALQETHDGRLRSEIRRRGHNRIDNLILAGSCGAAQTLFRQLRAGGAAPAADSFGDACPAP